MFAPAVAGTAAAAAGGATFLSTIGTALGIGATLYSGISDYQASQYEAKVAEMNARVADENAQSAAQKAQLEQQIADDETAGLIGTQLAQQGASGLAVSGRSSMMTRRRAAQLGRITATNIRQGGNAEVRNFNIDAANFRAKAAGDKFAGQAKLISSVLSAGGSLIGSAKPTTKTARFAVPARRYSPYYRS